ncbi:ammonium transporter [uncultured Bacteroides sp.]|uniref:ammonium transporter n=1 Tax=uncultured Bacteroides sp. TaxID=162156 RepID=UPI002AAC13D4|nr:ammonium transporter [uncultured Bacteroides sp.]
MILSKILRKETSFSPRVTMSRSEKTKLFFAVFSGKIIGMGMVIAAMIMLPGLIGLSANAAEVYTAHETAVINSLNTAWVLVAAALVFGMQAGFVMLEAGFARKRETVNVLIECILDTAICGVFFWAIGYAFMFSSGNGFIGYHWFFLQGMPATYGTTGIAILAHWIFQFAFADTASTITSGAMIGRTSFKGDILYSICVTGFIYPVIGHWAWGPDGFLALMGTPGHFLPTLGQCFRDFAGSTVVHTIGGVISLAGAIVLGPRIGRVFLRDDKDKGGLPAPHSLPLATLGAFLLWFGWYGFNPGSTLSAMDYDGIGRVAANTTIAACTGTFGAMILAYFFGLTKGKFDTSFSVNGLLGGLVAITCPCYWVSPFGSAIIGLVAGFVVFGGIYLLEYLRIDDPVGAVSVHGLNGIWGTLSLGLFATGQFGATGATGADNTAPVTGLFYGGGLSVLEAQAVGSAIVTIVTFAVAMVVMLIVAKLPYPWKLRIEPHGETGEGGIDVFEHGSKAYY